jgi:hypothetical protein
VTWDWSKSNPHFLCVCMYYAGNTSRHQYCHSNTRLHRYRTAQPAPFLFVLVSFFNQSITILPDGSGSSNSSRCILVYTDSARFDSYEPNLMIRLNRISTISLIRYCSAIRHRYASFAYSLLRNKLRGKKMMLLLSS